jgi:hypothetical protein
LQQKGAMGSGVFCKERQQNRPPLNGARASIFLTAVFVLVGLDAALFRSGFYAQFIKPDSSLGIYQFRRNLGIAKAAFSRDLVAFVGDSRVHDGFSSQIFDALSGRYGSSAVNLAVPSSAPRVWYYLLKSIDHNCNSFRVIVIPLPYYRDFDEIEDFVDRPHDLHFLMPYASLADAIDVLGTYSDPSMKLNACVQWLFKMMALRADLADFCVHPLARLESVSHFIRHGEREYYEYPGRKTCLDGVEFRGGRWTRGSANATEDIIARLNSKVLTPLPAQTGRRQRYNSYWLNKLLDRYASSKTKFVFVKMPTDPIARISTIPPDYTTLKSVASRRNVTILPEDYFADLDYPRFFGDEIHLNHWGRKIFSTRLSQYLLSSLAVDDALAVGNSPQFK